MKPHFKEEFIAFLKSLGTINSLHEAIATMSWCRAEAVCMNKSKQEPALFQSKDDKEIKMQIYKHDANNEITKEEVQFLVTILRDYLDAAADAREAFKDRMHDLWMLCDPEKAVTAIDFYELNQMKNEYRIFDKQYKKLQEIQRKLKKMR